MFRRLVVSAFVLAGSVVLVAAPSSPASATPLCEAVSYDGVTQFGVGPTCIPYPGPPECVTGPTGLGPAGTIWTEVCVPAA